MIACKQVAKALEKGDYNKLSAWSKFWLNAHVKLCTMCGGYHKHVMTMMDTARGFNEREEDLSSTEGSCLNPATAERIRSALRDAEQEKAE